MELRCVSREARGEALIGRLLRVWGESVRATHDFLRENDIRELTPLVAGGLRHIETLVAVVDGGGEAQGFLGVAEGKIEMLFLAPEARGHGLGRRCIAYALDELGATLVDVNEQNAQAVGFYLHMGFEVVSRAPLDGQGRPFPILHMRLAE